MSSLPVVFPLCCWGNKPQAATTAAVAINCNLIAVALSNSCWLYKCQGLDTNEQVTIEPFVFLVGHSSPISLGFSLTFLVTCSEDGEINTWDLTDGQCLASTNINESITNIKVTTNGKYIVCTGHTAFIYILDSKTLDLVKKVDSFGEWVSSLCIYSTDKPGIDVLYFAMMDGSILEAYFDCSICDFQNIHSVGHVPSAFHIQLNPFDKRMLFALTKNAAFIYIMEPSHIKLTAMIESHGEIWAGVDFLSLKTVILWTKSGYAEIYYLGSRQEISFSNRKDFNQDAVVLISNRTDVFYSNDLQMGNIGSYRHYELLARFESPDSSQSFITCHIPTDSKLSQKAHHLIHFDTRSDSFSGIAKVHTFWAGLLASEVPFKSTSDSFSNLPSINFKISHALNVYDSWPKLPNMQITCICMILKKYLAVGTAQGEIWIIPFSTVFSSESIDFRSAANQIFKTHECKISCLYPSEHKQSENERLLFCGTNDGWIYIWDLQTGRMLNSFCNHSQKVLGFVNFLPCHNSKASSWVASISLDNSISIIDIEDTQCLYRFFGHNFEIEKLFLKLEHDVIIIKCSDGFGYVWQLTAENLDRVFPCSDNHLVLQECTAIVDCSHLYSAPRKTNAKQTLEVVTIRSARRDTFPVVIFQVNTKRLIDEIYNGHQMLSPPTPKSLKKVVAASAPFNKKPTFRNLAEAFRKIGSSSTPVVDSAPKKVIIARGEKPELNVIESVFSSLMSWGLQSDIDRVCSSKLGLVPPGPHITFGIRGAKGKLTILAPHMISKEHWCISSNLNANRLLNIISLAQSVLSTHGLEAHVSTLITHYGIMLPDIVGRGFKFPSLSFLVNHWQDPVADIQQAARSLFNASSSKVYPEEKQNSINYWKQFVPSKADGTPMSNDNLQATIILSIICMEDPSYLPQKTCQNVSAALYEIINETSGANNYAMMAVEIMGRGFPTWEPYINGASTVRALVALTGLSSLPSAINLPSKKSTGVTGVVISTPQLTPAMMLTARQAIINVASANPGLVISTLSFDLQHSKNSIERAGSLKLLGMFFGKRLVLLYPYLSRIIEAMVKTLDPNMPEIRESLFPIVTVNFAELVRSYPNVSFHGPTQRLAVGAMEGMTIIYDLRTATKVAVLEGHSKPVSAVSFSSDGKMMASFSAEENCLKIWQPYSGFLGTLVGAFSSTSAGTGSALANIGGGKIKPYRSFNVGPPQTDLSVAACLDEIGFEWINDRGIKLRSINGTELIFNV